MPDDELRDRADDLLSEAEAEPEGSAERAEKLAASEDARREYRRRLMLRLL